jgi:hypothetical protein
MQPRRRIPRWKVLLALFGAFAFVCGSLGLWVWWAAERRWAEMKTGLLNVLREEMARPAERPVLRGATEPGNAWDDYEQALAVIGRMTPSDRSVLESFFLRENTIGRPRAERPPRSKVKRMMSAFESTLTHLRQGTCRARAQFHSRDLEGVEVRKLKGYHAFGLGYFAVVRSRFLAEDGKGGEAAELLLDLGQFSRDYSAAVHPNVKFAWGSLQDLFLNELSSLVRSGRLSPEMLLQVDRELELLDRSTRPFGPMDPPDLLRLGFGFLEADKLFRYIRSGHEDEERIPLWGSWRFCFSDRLMVADAFTEASEWLRTCDTLRSSSWTEIQRAQAGFEERVLRSPNPVVRLHMRWAGNWMPITRMAQARLRLLRIAAVHQATGEFLELEDPFGGALRRAEIGCRYKLWSVGRDGNDDGGDGFFTGTSTNIKDIVLEIER